MVLLLLANDRLDLILWKNSFILVTFLLVDMDCLGGGNHFLLMPLIPLLRLCRSLIDSTMATCYLMDHTSKYIFISLYLIIYCTTWISHCQVWVNATFWFFLLNWEYNGRYSSSFLLSKWSNAIIFSSISLFDRRDRKSVV